MYREGDRIGQQYRVLRILGRGGFGVVYLVSSLESGFVCALKTFRDEYLQEKKTRDRFRQEAGVWVDVGEHPNLVRAYLAHEIEGRLHVAMEYVAPNEKGLNSLQGYLDSQPPNLEETLHWSVQFCNGMEH